jgi:iron complex outermembrane recepter protein
MPNRWSLRSTTILAALFTATIVGSVGIPSPAAAQAAGKRSVFDIPAQNLSDSLRQYGRATGTEIIFAPDAVRGKQAPALKGEYDRDEALKLLLEGSGLNYHATAQGAIMVEPARGTEKATRPPEQRSGTEPGASGSTANQSVPDQHYAESKKAAERDQDLEQIVVTGSRIAKVASQVAAQVITLSEEDLRATGEITLEGALTQLPQNVYGASPTGAAIPGATSFNGALNLTGGSSVNLRGLGSAATLVLVNGQRIGKSGLFGGESDITGIPLTSIADVQILLDGASSIYGSDAVGGVMNVILKNKYDGFDASVEMGYPEQGGFHELQADLSKGFDWGSGHFAAFYEFFDRTDLEASNRPQLLTHSYYGSPAYVHAGPLFYTYNGKNINANVVNQEYPNGPPPGYTLIRDSVLPSTGNGDNLTLSQFVPLLPIGFLETSPYAYSNNNGIGFSLLPEQVRHSLQIVASQDLTDSLSLTANLYYSHRQTIAGAGPFDFSAPVYATDPRNPFGVDITTNWFISNLPDRYYDTQQEVYRWNFALHWQALRDWDSTLAFGQNRDRFDGAYYNTQITTVPLTGTVNVPATLFNNLVAQGLNLLAPNIETANSAKLLSQLVYPAPLPVLAVNDELFLKNDITGKLFHLPGGDAQIALGGEWREETLDTYAGTPVTGSGFESDINASLPDSNAGYPRVTVGRTQHSGYSEVLFPVIGADNGIPALRQLTFTGSGRYDVYSTFGSDVTWSGGMVWQPIEQVLFKVNDSTAFVAPTPAEALVPATTQIFPFPPGTFPYFPIVNSKGQPTGQFASFDGQTYGGNPDLKAETARSITAGGEFRPVPGFSINLDWYRTAYLNKIDNAAPIVLVQGANWNLVPHIIVDSAGGIIADFRAQNDASYTISGIDYQMKYLLNTDFGQWTVSGNVAYVESANLVAYPGSPVVSQVASVSFESSQVLPRYRYTGSLGWRRKGISAVLTSNSESKTISNGLDPDEGAIVRTSKAAVITNLTASYDFSQGGFADSRWLRGTTATFRVLNLFDSQPQYTVRSLLYPNIAIAEINSNIADPRGRMFYVGVHKSF